MAHPAAGVRLESRRPRRIRVHDPPPWPRLCRSGSCARRKRSLTKARAAIRRGLAGTARRGRRRHASVPRLHKHLQRDHLGVVQPLEVRLGRRVVPLLPLASERAAPCYLILAQHLGPALVEPCEHVIYTLVQALGLRRDRRLARVAQVGDLDLVVEKGPLAIHVRLLPFAAELREVLLRVAADLRAGARLDVLRHLLPFPAVRSEAEQEGLVLLPRPPAHVLAIRIHAAGLGHGLHHVRAAGGALRPAPYVCQLRVAARGLDGRWGAADLGALGKHVRPGRHLRHEQGSGRRQRRRVQQGLASQHWLATFCRRG
eukprot:scaffold537_cov241-Pinguiococcus_pyrenoidosus.AAC.24